MDIIWETPTPRNDPNADRRAELNAFRQALRDNPGEWARYPRELAPSTINGMPARIRKAEAPMHSCWGPAGSFESVTRSVDKQIVLYVRYVGHSS